MRAEDLLEKVRPTGRFRPVRLHTTDGHAYDIHHPEGLLIERRAVDIAYFPDPTRRIAHRVDRVSLLHITRVEPLTDEIDEAI